MEQGKSSAGLKVALLLGGAFLACAAAALLSIIVAIALSSGMGAGATGDRMMIVLGLLGCLFFATLPFIFFLTRRWTGRTGLAAAMALLAALGHGLIWICTLFVMAVLLNR